MKNALNITNKFQIKIVYWNQYDLYYTSHGTGGISARLSFTTVVCSLRQAAWVPPLLQETTGTVWQPIVDILLLTMWPMPKALSSEKISVK